MGARRIAAWFDGAALAGVACAAHAVLPIQEWRTSGGARVYFVENRDLPMLDISVEFPAGAGYDRAEKSGVAAMTNRLLKSGTAAMSEDRIARGLADIGAEMGPSFDTDRGGMTMRTLSSEKERTQALDIFTRVLSRPTFPAEILEREKVRLIGSLKESDTRPGTIASRTFYRLVYRDHPYGLRSSGEVATVPGITRDDLVDFHRRHYAARYAVVAMIGDLTRAQAEVIAEQVTRGLPGANGDAPALRAVPPLAAGVTRRVDHHATQAHILVGAPGISRSDPDYVPLYVGNFILGGGGFVSRITDEVRQKRGLAYSASSYFYPLQRRGPFVISMQTRRDQASQALEVAVDTLRKFMDEGPTEQELAAAKKNIVGSFALRIDSNRKIHGYLGLIGFYRLPLTYLEDFVKGVERVSTDDIRNAFQRRIQPDHLVTVVVAGDEKKPE